MSASRSADRRHGHAQPVAVRVDEVDLACRRLLVDRDTELGGDRVDVVDPDIDQPVRIGVAGMLRQVDLRTLAPDADVGGEVRFETVFEDEFETQSSVPGQRLPTRR